MSRRRFRWRCHRCGSFGWELSPEDAKREGIAHYLAAHDGPTDA